MNNLSDEVSVYKGKLSDLSRECDVLKSKLASSRPDFSQSSITTTEKSSPAALQSATPGRTYIRTPDNAKAPRPGSRPRAMSQNLTTSDLLCIRDEEDMLPITAIVSLSLVRRRSLQLLR